MNGYSFRDGIYVYLWRNITRFNKVLYKEIVLTRVYRETIRPNFLALYNIITELHINW